jgi:hypothetical protein
VCRGLGVRLCAGYLKASDTAFGTLGVEYSTAYSTASRLLPPFRGLLRKAPLNGGLVATPWVPQVRIYQGSGFNRRVGVCMGPLQRWCASCICAVYCSKGGCVLLLAAGDNRACRC